MGLAFSEVSSTAYQEGHDDTATFIGMARGMAVSFRVDKWPAMFPSKFKMCLRLLVCFIVTP